MRRNRDLLSLINEKQFSSISESGPEIKGSDRRARMSGFAFASLSFWSARSNLRVIASAAGSHLHDSVHPALSACLMDDGTTKVGLPGVKTVPAGEFLSLKRHRSSVHKLLGANHL